MTYLGLNCDGNDGIGSRPEWEWRGWIETEMGMSGGNRNGNGGSGPEGGLREWDGMVGKDAEHVET